MQRICLLFKLRKILKFKKKYLSTLDFLKKKKSNFFSVLEKSILIQYKTSKIIMLIISKQKICNRFAYLFWRTMSIAMLDYIQSVFLYHELPSSSAGWNDSNSYDSCRSPVATKPSMPTEYWTEILASSLNTWVSSTIDS